MLKNKNEPIKMYSDGGCRGNQNSQNIGAYGAYLTLGDIKYEVGGYELNTTNNIMELKGCIEGLKHINIKDYPVEVYLDSAYVLNGITNWIHGWKKNNWINSSKQPVKNAELWKELDEERNKFSQIKFIKVKGHSDNLGNIRADEICNEYMDKCEKERGL